MQLAPGPFSCADRDAFYVIAIGAQQGFGAELAGVHHVLARCDISEAPRGEGRGEEPKQTTSVLVPLRPALNHGLFVLLVDGDRDRGRHEVTSTLPADSGEGIICPACVQFLLRSRELLPLTREATACGVI